MSNAGTDDRFYSEIAAAWLRGLGRTGDDDDLIAGALRDGVSLQRFKKSVVLPRVRKVLGVLRGLSPSSLLDIGSGRGTFLWPLLDTRPHYAVTAVELNPIRLAMLGAVMSDGHAGLRAAMADVTRLPFAAASIDVITCLEVLEHLRDPAAGVAELVRVATRFVVVSVPSHEDDNPEHLHLIDRRTMETMFLAAGARRFQADYVLNHMVGVATL